jgi:NMD protein affecting ribosome stability and mRNA decay
MQKAIQFYDTNKDEGDPEDKGEEIHYRVTQGQCMKCGKGTVDLYPMTLQFTAYPYDVEIPVKIETKLCKACLNEEYKHFYHYTEQYKLGREQR